MGLKNAYMSLGRLVGPITIPAVEPKDKSQHYIRRKKAESAIVNFIMKTKLTLLILLLALTACSTGQPAASGTPTPAPVSPTPIPSPRINPSAAEGEITAISSNAMRFLPVRTDLAFLTPIDIPLAGNPVWTAGIPFQDGFAWAVALEDGSLQAFSVDTSGYAQAAISPENLPASSPLTIYSQGGQLFALSAPSDVSPFDQPILLDENALAYIATNGDLVITREGAETRLPVNALPDSLLVYNRNRLLFLSGPTERYSHGVLGDSLEATGITLVQTSPEVSILNTIPVPAADVIEGLYPTWVDMNLDGQLEIIVTLSNAQDGARMVAFHEDGSIAAEGPAIGTGYRWRHQLMSAPFGEAGKTLLAVIRTPHIGGVLEFYRLNGDKLEIVAEIPGLSSHSIGSRNLFTVQAGDFDRDGQVELLAPDQSHTRLGIVGVDGVSHWIELDAELATNLAAVTIPASDRFALAAGLSNNVLRIWLSNP